MLIDHVGFAFLGKYPIYRYIGRLSMPLFAYLIANGMRYTIKHHTEKEYVIRLFVLAVISQIPFNIFFRPVSLCLNICFSWVIAALTIWGANQLPKEYQPLALPLVVIILFESAFEFSFLAAGFAVIFWLFLIKKDLPGYRYGCAVILVAVFIIRHPAPIHIFYLFGFMLVDILRTMEKRHKQMRKKIPKVIAYSFYPAHMLILSAIRAVVESIPI